MSEMPGNPHYFKSAPDNVGTLDARELTGAILALAFEQRIANLIAWYDGADKPLTPGDGRRGIYDEIVKRLGLTEKAGRGE